MRRQIIFLLTAFSLMLNPMDVYGLTAWEAPEMLIEDEMLEIKKQNSLDSICDATEEEIDIIALVALGEAEGESELGKRLVIDTILNRVDSEKWPDTILDVCWQKGQYCCLHNGRCGTRLKEKAKEDYIRSLVIDEMNNRTNYDVIHFSAGGYNGSSPLFQEGGHYFSK